MMLLIIYWPYMFVVNHASIATLCFWIGAFWSFCDWVQHLWLLLEVVVLLVALISVDVLKAEVFYFSFYYLHSNSMTEQFYVSRDEVLFVCRNYHFLHFCEQVFPFFFFSLEEAECYVSVLQTSLSARK